MDSPSRKSHPTMAASGRIKRSELEDATKKSLNREGNLLNNTLKQYDRAKKVVKKGLESDERETAKFTRKIQSMNFGHILSSQSEMRAKGSSDSSALTTPRREPTFHDRALRAKSTKTSSGKNGGRIVKRGPEKGNLKVGENRYPDNGPHEYPAERDDLDFSDSHPNLCIRREMTRAEMFNNLSKPKKKSDVLSVRARLRAEFDTPNPQMSRGFLVRSTTCPDMTTMHGSRFPTGRYGSPLEVTPRRGPVRKPQDLLGSKATLHSRKETNVSSVTTANGQPLTEEDINTLLVPPKPVVVKR